MRADAHCLRISVRGLLSSMLDPLGMMYEHYESVEELIK